MSFTHVKVRVENTASPESTIEAELLVDTGALYSVLSTQMLKDMGIELLTKRRFKTADGRIIERGVGEVLMELLGKRRHVPIAFGEDSDVSVLGTTALEIFGLEVDPNTKQLKPATLRLQHLAGNGVDELEHILRELLSLAKRKPLPEEDLERAKHLLAKLREMGWTNREVSDLTDGGWSEPTVKLYTRGARVKNPNPREKATSLLIELVSRGLSLDDVESFLSLKRKVEAKGVSFDELAEVLEESKKQSVDVKGLVELYKDIKRAALTITQVKDVLSYKAELESLDITLDSLKNLVGMASKIGKYENVVKSIKEYGELTKIQQESSRLSAEVRGLNTKKVELQKSLDGLVTDIEKLRTEEAEVREAIRKYKELVEAGFTDDVLSKVKDALSRFGELKGALSAINTYARLKEIEEEKGNVEAELKTVQGEYSSLQPVIALCREMLYKYGFSVDTINRLYELAKRHGNPYEAIKAFGAYGDLKVLQKELEKVETAKSAGEARVKEIKVRIQENRGIAEELKNSTKGLLKPLSSEISRSVESMNDAFIKVMHSITARYEEHLNTLKNAYEEYLKRFGEVKAEAGKLEEELKLARVVNAIIKYPSTAKDLPIEYALLLQDAVAKFCMAKGVNPKVKAGDIMHSKYYLGAHREVELRDLFDWAKRGLQASPR